MFSGLTCVVCHVNCDTQKIMEQHVQSPRHLAMAKKQRNHPASDPDIATGTFNNFKISNESEEHEDDVRCKLCNVTYTSSSQAQSHLNGKSHKKKLANCEAPNVAGAVQSTRESSISTSTRMSSNRHQLPTHHLASHSSAVTPLVYTTCQVFDSGPEKVQQHYNCEKQIKKVNQCMGTKPVDSCSICNVSFTGSENEKSQTLSQEHQYHLKMMEKKERGFHTSCNACGCEFIGREHADTHFASAKHRQNLENMNKQSGDIGGSPTDLERSPVQLIQSIPTPESVTFTTGQDRETQPFRVIAPVAVRPDSTQIMMQQEGRAFLNHCSGTTINASHSLHEYDEIVMPGRSNDSKDGDSCDEPFTTTEQDIHPHGENLVVKYVEDGNGNLVNKEEIERDVQDRDSEDGSLDIKAIEIEHVTPFNSLNDEVKIKAETYTSITRSFDSYSTGVGHGDCSSRETEIVRYVQNDLGYSLTPLGRGCGIFSMLQQHADKFPGKVVNIDGRSKDHSANTDAHHDASETLRKSVWIGTNAAPKSEVPISAEHTGTSSNTVTHSPSLDETGNPDLSKLSTAHSHTSTEHVKTTDGNNETPAYLNEDTGRIDASSSLIAHSSNTDGATMYRRMSSDGGESFNIGYDFDHSLERGICHICDITLTSRKHMMQHIEGKNHMRAREVRRQLVATSRLADNPYVCRICTVTFSGLESREQHMQSEKHKKKERRLLTGENENEHYCDICKITCSGTENYQQHLLGAQHGKMSGILDIGNRDTIQGLLGLVGDRTQWYPCNVCNCSMNTYEQLIIHEKSQKHLKQLEKQNVCADILTQDRTVWYPCQICKCSLNTPEQLRRHEASPAHISKLPNFGAGSYPSAGLDIISEHRVDNRQANTCITPLDKFLSEELFPEQFLPRSDIPVEHKDDAASRKLVEDDDRMIHVSNETGIRTSSTSEERPGGNGSDLAWATRSRGTRDNNSRTDSTGSSPSENVNLHGARPKQPNTSLTINNPYAATHSYYCHTCKSPSNTRECYESHLRGKRHMQKVCTEPAPHRAHHAPLNLPREYLPFTQAHARNYQRELYKKAMKDDSLCFLPTGERLSIVFQFVYLSRKLLGIVDRIHSLVMFTLQRIMIVEVDITTLCIC